MKIVLRCALNGIVFRMIGLDNNLAAQLSTSGSARYLSQKLEDSFRSTEIRQRKRMIGSHDPH